MSKLIRFVNHSLKHFFVRDVEDSCGSSNQFKDDSPYPFADSNFEAVLVRRPEESADCFVCREAFYYREDIVLQSDQRGTCNLRGKIVGLTLAKAEQPLPFLKDDFQGPSSGTNSVSLRESEFHIRAEQSAPRPSLASAYEEKSYWDAGKDNIRAHVAASEFTGIPLFSSFAEKEPDLVKDCPSYHLYGKVNLVHGVLTGSILKRSARSPFRGISPREFLGTHSKVSLLALLANEGKIKQHLAHAIREAKEERLESEDAFVFKVRIDTSDVLYTLACLWEIRVINHQAGVHGFVVTAYSDFCPQLRTDMVHGLAPVGAGVIEEIIEDILSAPKLAA